jgi:hypothetical protein
VQSVPQPIPPGALVTVPAPLPPFVTLRVKLLGGTVLNVAPTVLAASIVTRQDPVPAQGPVQPANAEPESAVAVSVTGVLAE